MLTNQHIDIVKSTIPLLESAGPALTQHFYQRMFSHNPELKDIFNMTHQKTGRQSVALFEAIAAYAKNIENLAALSSAVERIAHKHTSFNIKAEHYQIVGLHLIETLRELAPDAFTTEVEEAWTAAYLFLAQIFIDRESALYLESEAANGGWAGARSFIVSDKVKESEVVTSFVLTPEDNQAVIAYKAGQYIGIEVTPSQSEHIEIRQYSLSQASNNNNYRISVKKEGEGSQLGLVSNYLHDEVNVGDKVNLMPPAGDFFYVEKQRPVVLISAGVGCTPMQAILQQLAGTEKAEHVTYLHACENQTQHAFLDETDSAIVGRGWASEVWYNTATFELNKANTHQGLMDLKNVANPLPLEEGDFYLCGPVVFMESIVKQLEALGVSRENIHYEVFGPHAYL